MGKKEKKEKITYIDDGRTLADMSGIHDGRAWLHEGTHSSPKDIWHTYWDAVRMMLRPMLVVVGCMVLVFVIITILFTLM